MVGRTVLLLALGWVVHAAHALGTDPAADVLLAFGYLALASVVAGQLAERLGLPKLVGYLVIGVVAGPCGLRLVSEPAASSLGLAGDTALGMLALGAGCRANVSRARTMSRPARAIAVGAVVALGAAVGVLVAAFTRCAPRGAAAFAVVVCVAVAALGARLQPAPPIVMLAAGVWLAGCASASARALADQIARVRLPLVLVWCSLAGARLG